MAKIEERHVLNLQVHFYDSIMCHVDPHTTIQLTEWGNGEGADICIITVSETQRVELSVEAMNNLYQMLDRYLRR